MRPLPSWSLSEPFCSTSWSMAVYLSSSPCHLPACRLAAVISHSSLWLVWHISLLLSSSKSPKQGSCWRVDVLVCEDSGYLLKYELWRRYPLVEEIVYIDKFKSCTLRRHLWFSDFGWIWCHVIIVLCIVFVQCLVSTLQMQRHCIHVAFERGC